MCVEISDAVQCYHCGHLCEDVTWLKDKPFCCVGCQSVFEILNENNLCEYYSLEQRSGVSQSTSVSTTFDFLDDALIRKRLLSFDSKDLSKVTFNIPAIHCVSCIWLLENLRKLNAGVLHAEVSFGRKTVTIDFDPKLVKLSSIGTLLSTLGYAPSVNLDSVEKKNVKPDQSLVYKLSIAGFCFGNIMLFSFPEYLGLDRADEYLMRVFSWLNLVLAVPVFFYSASGYFTSAWATFKQKQINIDVPIAAGLLALFLRSSYDILTFNGPGYLDSFSGLVFFLLVGRWFQSKTYESLAFDRDFRSYFPLAVNRLVVDEWKPVVIYELKRGDRIRIRNMEIVPTDSVLLDGNAYFDYSFVTGEAKPVKVFQGDIVYAGGRLIGQPIELVVENKTSQSHLTSLWNNDSFKKRDESRYQKIIDRAARKFTWIVMGLAVVTAIAWYFYKPDQMWLVLTSVLMVACPCALALAAPFTYGTMLRAFGRNSLYLKNADVIERLASIDTVVFDKTGTVTYGHHPEVNFTGVITPDELSRVKLLANSSTHPLSSIVSKSIAERAAEKLSYFKEIPGKGVQAFIEGQFIQMGSAEFVGVEEPMDPTTSRVFVAIDDSVKGYFTLSVRIRENIKDMLDQLGKKCVALLSGDNQADFGKMETLFNSSVQLLFNQDPHAKLAFITNLQKQGKKVLMVGDGLNDSGALKQSDVGIAVTDDTGVFTPACDGILSGDNLVQLDRFMALARSSSIILKLAFGISFFYNAIALTFAVTGHLTPLAAAILMPLSSISVVGFSTLAVKYVTHKKLTSWLSSFC
jgi:P-type Cu+ transporter